MWGRKWATVGLDKIWFCVLQEWDERKMYSVWVNAVLFQHFDLIFLFLVIMQHSVLGDLTLCLYYIQKYVLFFFMHNFSLCNKKGILRSRIHPIVWVVFAVFLTPLPVCMDTCIWVLCMFVFLCVLWFALLLSVNFCKHERKQQKILWRTHAIM